MTKRIGIRREDKNIWERRVPLIPEHVKQLKEEHDIVTVLQPSENRAFSYQEYINAGAKIDEELSNCPIVFAVKEIPIDLFEQQKTYIFFSHTVKGQSYNMPMLKQIMDLKCQLIDYERVVDANDRRLVFFGRHAGLAGMVDTLWAFGRRLRTAGIETPFEGIRQAHQYESLSQAKSEIFKIGERIRSYGLPLEITPIICGFAGYGNVSKGAQEILDLFPTIEAAPESLEEITKGHPLQSSMIYKVIFKEDHLVEPRTPGSKFNLHDYYQNPEKYRSKFENYLPYLSILVNAIYWEPRYPRFVTKAFLREMFESKTQPRLRVIGDITCDIEGTIECTLRATLPDNPVYTFDPITEKIVNGYKGRGPVIMAVDNLPCEFPREASMDFSQALFPFIPAIVNADYSVPFEQLQLPEEIRRAVVVYQGQFTPEYKYMERFLR